MRHSFSQNLALDSVPMKLATVSFSVEAVLHDRPARLHSVYTEWPESHLT